MARTALLIGALCVAAIPMGTGAAVAAEGAGAPGSSWRAPEVVSPGVGVFAPRVATNGSGSAVAAWLPYVTAPRAQAAFRWFGGPWEPAENLPAGVRWPASIAIDESGNVLVHWIVNRQLRMTVRPAATGKWSPPQTVAANVNRGAVVVAPNGTLVAAWTRGSGAKRTIEAAVRGAGAADWNEPRVLAGPASVGGSEVAIDRVGTVVVSWRQGPQAFFASRPPGGPWGATETPPDLAPVPPSPRIVVGPSGDLMSVGNVGLDSITALRRPGGAWQPYDPQFQVQDLLSVQLDGYGNGTALAERIGPRPDGPTGNTHFVEVAERPASGPWTTFRPLSDPNKFGFDATLDVNPSGAAAATWASLRGLLRGVTAAYRPSPTAPFGDPEVLVDPRPGIGETGIQVDDAGRALAYWVQDYKLMVADRSLGRPGAVRLTAGQLRTNQRIAQAAVRSANALAARLQGGLTGADIRQGALGAPSFAPGVTLSGRDTHALVGPGAPGATAPAGGGSTAGRAPAITAAQLLINQRISQAALRRANAIRAMLAAGLTGGNFADGTIAAAQLAPGLGVTRAVAGGEVPATPLTIPAAPRKPAGRVELTPAQLLVNQRISQAAVRRLNALAERIEHGLTAREIRPGTITATDLAPELRT